MFIKILPYVLLILLCGVTSQCLQRSVVSVLNPNCPATYNCSSSVAHLFYVRANGESDSLHYFWNFNYKPSMTVALTSLESKVSFLWPKFSNQSFVSNGTIKFSQPPTYIFGVVMNWLFEFNDVSDIGRFNASNLSSSYMREVPMPSNWALTTVTSLNDSVKLKMLGTWNSTDQGISSGQLELNLEAYGRSFHGDRLPRLLHTANSSQLEMILRDVSTSSGFTSRRLGIHLIVTANEHTKENFTAKSYKGLDDENTPGIFTLTELQSPASVNKSSGGYLQWRPVSYIADIRDITNSTEMYIYPDEEIASVTVALNHTLLTTFSGFDLDTFRTQSYFLSFGASGDGFYSKYNYTSWTVSMGYGSPPLERFSVLVILVISACIVVPILLILGSSVYLCVRSLAKRKDDLLITS